ncbi:MAG: hypothetical protein Q8Q39_00730 [bacterium]|nr:hypothetical protein [bacterium]
MPDIKPQTSNAKIFWIAVVIIIAIGILLQQYLKNAGPSSGDPSATPRPTAPEDISVDANINDWLVYENKKMQFTAKYPASANLRGTAESDVVIFEFKPAEMQNTSANATLRKRNAPLGKEPYATVEAFWEDEKTFIASQSGVVSNERYVSVNDRTFFEAQEDNRLNNYMGLHRYILLNGNVYEASLVVAGDRLLAPAVDAFNAIVSTFDIN